MCKLNRFLINIGIVISTANTVHASITTSGNITPTYDGTDPWTFGNPGLYVGKTAPGSLSITSGSEVIVGGYDAIISNATAASTSSVSVDGAGSLWSASSIFVGASGIGTLSVTNGGKATSTLNYFAVGSGSTGGGAATVSGNGSSIIASSEIDVGAFGTGGLDITNGGAVSYPASTFYNHTYIGVSAGSSGTVTVGGGSGTSNLTGLDYLYVGNDGTGRLDITGGGVVSESQSATIGVNPGSKGTVNVGGGTGKRTMDQCKRRLRRLLRKWNSRHNGWRHGHRSECNHRVRQWRNCSSWRRSGQLDLDYRELFNCWFFWNRHPIYRSSWNRICDEVRRRKRD